MVHLTLLQLVVTTISSYDERGNRSLVNSSRGDCHSGPALVLYAALLATVSKVTLSQLTRVSDWMSRVDDCNWLDQANQDKESVPMSHNVAMSDALDRIRHDEGQPNFCINIRQLRSEILVLA